MVPTVDQLSDYFHSVEHYVITVVSSAAPEVPTVREAVNRIWDDLARFGPPAIAEMKSKIPVLGDFELPLPPPPSLVPPAPQFWYTKPLNWSKNHKWATAGVGAVGAGLLVGYVSTHSRRSRPPGWLKAASTGERRRVVVVLGGDHPLALPLILDLESKGYIVITSVESPETVQELEGKCHGYVRALVLDPSDPSTIPPFLRALASTMSRRFPIHAAGDPYASSNTQAYIHSVISLLTLPSSDPSAASSIQSPDASPLEHVSISESYLPYLQSTHLTPLQVVQSLLPLFRTSPARPRDKASRSIIICLPATDTRVGLPFAGVSAMSAAATLKATEVLRREVGIAAMGDHGDGMKNLRVVTVDVGAIGTIDKTNSRRDPWNGEESMKDWTASEKATYGSAFAALSLEEGSRIARRPTPVKTFVRKVANIVEGAPRVSSVKILGLQLWNLHGWFARDRISVGAGAQTYKLASRLPSFLLDALLNLPHILLAIRNALVPIQPHVLPAPVASPTTHTHHKRRMIAARPDSEQSLSDDEDEAHSVQRREQALSDVETGSEADIESNAENDSGAEHGDHVVKNVENSWVQLNPWK